LGSQASTQGHPSRETVLREKDSCRRPYPPLKGTRFGTGMTVQKKGDKQFREQNPWIVKEREEEGGRARAAKKEASWETTEVQTSGGKKRQSHLQKKPRLNKKTGAPQTLPFQKRKKMLVFKEKQNSKPRKLNRKK